MFKNLYIFFSFFSLSFVDLRTGLMGKFTESYFFTEIIVCKRNVVDWLLNISMIQFIIYFIIKYLQCYQHKLYVSRLFDMEKKKNIIHFIKKSWISNNRKIENVITINFIHIHFSYLSKKVNHDFPFILPLHLCIIMHVIFFFVVIYSCRHDKTAITFNNISLLDTMINCRWFIFQH